MTAQEIKHYWTEQRTNLLDTMRAAHTPEQRREAATAVRKFNMALAESQARGVVLPIKAETIQRALHPKPDKKQQGWMIHNYVQ